MGGYYEGYSYVGIMPDGKKKRFATEREYLDEYWDAIKDSEDPCEIFMENPVHCYRVRKEG